MQPVEGRCKVYILDEAHSLTTDASNALLKTLEEPPAHVVFVLCTTEPHRLLDTIKGRCQAFAFTRPGLDELDTVLRWVATGEGIEIEDAALDLVARAGRGSSRDAISRARPARDRVRPPGRRSPTPARSSASSTPPP